jgi:hypothetical protein
MTEPWIDATEGDKIPAIRASTGIAPSLVAACQKQNSGRTQYLILVNTCLTLGVPLIHSGQFWALVLCPLPLIGGGGDTKTNLSAGMYYT